MHYNQLRNLREGMISELNESIIPYWTQKMYDNSKKTFHSRIDGKNNLIQNNYHSLILNTRLLWTFSAIYNQFDDVLLLEYINASFSQLEKYFYDIKYTGYFWSIEADGKKLDDSKKTYGQSFAIYALSESYRATLNPVMKKRAIDLFDMIDNVGYDFKSNAYYESFTANWQKQHDVRLSDQDPQELRSTNTHLHLIESFANLYRIWPDSVLKSRLDKLLRIFIEKVYNKDGAYFHAFFDEDWNPKPFDYSFGHDIETAWLMLDAARLLKNDDLIKKCEEILISVSDNLLSLGLDKDFGGVCNKFNANKITDSDKHWWVQAESIVGLVYAYQISSDSIYLDAATDIWTFIENLIIDKKNGEWFFKVNKKGEPYFEDDKAGPWKCPYHTSRSILEVNRISQEILGETETQNSIKNILI